MREYLSAHERLANQQMVAGLDPEVVAARNAQEAAMPTAEPVGMPSLWVCAVGGP
jgi:hypothetical protein